MSKKRRTFHLFFKLISNSFDLIFFMGVASKSSSESHWGNISMGACWNLSLNLSSTSSNLANLFSACNFFYFYWNLRATIRQVTKASLGKGWVYDYELSGCGFESRCCHLNFRYSACFSKEFLDIQDKL